MPFSWKPSVHSVVVTIASRVVSEIKHQSCQKSNGFTLRQPLGMGAKCMRTGTSYNISACAQLLVLQLIDYTDRNSDRPASTQPSISSGPLTGSCTRASSLLRSLVMYSGASM